MRSTLSAAPAVPDLGARHRDGADPGLHLKLSRMTVMDQARPPVREPQIRPLRQESLDLQLHRLGQALASAGPQYLRQGIIDGIRPTKPYDIAVLVHGVSLSGEVLAGLTPASIRRPSQATVSQILA